MLAGMLALADEPIAGGRHKVFGHPDLAVIPQTSTIASHLPRALGVAFAIGRAKRLGVPTAWPVDALAICSFGDASANHSTAQGAINAARYTAHQGLPLPLLFVCEDNGWGISVPTPSRWIETAFGDIGRAPLRVRRRQRPRRHVRRRRASSPRRVRANRRPALLHLRTVRFMGHAGTDVESGYRSIASIRDDELRDPILGTARLLVERRAARRPPSCAPRCSRRAPRFVTQADVDDRRADADDRRRGDGAAVAAPSRRRRSNASASRPTPNVACRVLRRPAARVGGSAHARRDDQPHARRPAAPRDPTVLVFGEDVGAKGGVYGVTRGLQKRAGAARVFDTLLDEQSILGIALGAGVSGLLPIPEIQYLAYLHNAEDQLRGEAASLSFFSQRPVPQPDGRARRRARLPEGLRRPLPQRQRGRRAARHPRARDRLARATPPTPRRCCARASRPPSPTARCRCSSNRSRCTTPATCTSRGDEGWTAPYAAPDAWAAAHVPIGEARRGSRRRRRADRDVGERAATCRSVRPSGSPPTGSRAGCSTCAGWRRCRSTRSSQHASEVGRVVVVDETRRSGGVGEAVLAGLVDHRVDVAATRRVTGPRHVHPARRRRPVRARQRGRHRRRRPRRRRTRLTPPNCLLQTKRPAV